MQFFLRLKHWQLFLLTWGIPLVVSVVSFSDPLLLLKLFPVMMVMFYFGTFGWMWAIATTLHSKLPADVRVNLVSFKIAFIIPSLYLAAVLFWTGTNLYVAGDSPERTPMMVATGAVFLVVGHLASMVCIVLAIRFAAKTMRSVELGRLARLNDYIGEFFLIWFSFIGYWILQPRLNKLVNEK